ncbi:MAG: dipeptidase [Bryobacteraceae bacterium]
MRFLFLITAALAIQAQTIGIDTHLDVAQRVLIEGVDLANRLPDGQVDIPRLREGGMNAPFFALWVPTFYKGSEAVRRTLDLRDAMQGLLDKHPDLIELATTAAGIERITKAHKIAAILSLEGGHQIDDDLRVLRMYQRMGIRAMTLTHFRNNNWADSSTDKPEHNGLTDFGKQVVREMNRIGMIVDISHVSDKTFYDAVAVSTKPVLATHSSCRALTDVPRDMTDDMLRALARNGGVISINFYPGFINAKDAEAGRKLIQQQSAHEPDVMGAALDEYAKKAYFDELRRMKPANATIDDVVAHIDHAVKVAGIDHVGIGSDFDGIDSVPKGLEDISKMPKLAAALKQKGYSDADIRKIWGGNVLRLIRTVVGN